MNKNLKIILSALVLIFSSPAAWAQADYPWLRAGDELYSNRAYADAETAYRKAQEEKDKPTTSFNLGNTIYKQSRIPEAITQFERAISLADDPGIKADAWYNLGNAHYQNQDLEKSIQAYKESLKLRPGDDDAKKNLMLAMRHLQQQQQQQDQQKKDQDQQNQQDQQPPSDADQQENQDQQQQSSSQQQSRTEQEQETRKDLSHEEAKEILKAIEREDQRVQEKLKKGNAKAMPPVKDW